MAAAHGTMDSRSYWKVKIFKYLGSSLANKNVIPEKENVDLKEEIRVLNLISTKTHESRSAGQCKQKWDVTERNIMQEMINELQSTPWHALSV